MDYKGQVYNEYVYQLIFFLFAVLAFVTGYVAEDFDVTFKIWASSLFIVLVVCVPDWHVFNKHPIAWVGKATTVTCRLSEEELLKESTSEKDSEIRARVRNAQRRKAVK